MRSVLTIVSDVDVPRYVACWDLAVEADTSAVTFKLLECCDSSHGVSLVSGSLRLWGFHCCLLAVSVC